jgi:two-component system phosphate regulon sensor histidine kinase PhoR
VQGVVRLALPRAVIESTNTRIERIVLIESGVACMVTIVLWFGAAHWLVRLLRRLTGSARRMAGGDLDVRTQIHGTDEVAELGETLDQLASNLSKTMHELRDERDLQLAMLDGLEEGVLVVDRAGRIQRCNPALRSLLLLPSDSIGRPLWELVPNEALEALVGRSAPPDAAPEEFEIEVDGIKPRRLLVRLAALPSQASALLLVFHDVTEMRRLETMRRDFVANVSHELRTPVAAIRSAADTLVGAATRRPEAMGRFVDMVGRNAEYLQRLIDDLLDLSRIEAKELKVRQENVAVDALAAHVVSLFRERAEQRSVSLTALVPEGARVLADPRALEQVLSNLVDNAIKYCPGAGVTLSWTSDQRFARMRVEDNGPGISADHLPRVFERFYRVETGRSRDLGGTGLGLSIAKHLVDAMGGAIGVESALGKGTVFTVSLPIARVVPSKIAGLAATDAD